MLQSLSRVNLLGRAEAWMFGRLFGRESVLLAAGERARLVHERWLNRAMTDLRRDWPVIPTRRVADGGFARLMATPEGRAWARQWWDSAFSRLDQARFEKARIERD